MLQNLDRFGAHRAGFFGRIVVFCAAAVMTLSSTSHAQYTITSLGSAVTENFTGYTGLAAPTNWTVTNNGTANNSAINTIRYVGYDNGVGNTSGNTLNANSGAQPTNGGGIRSIGVDNNGANTSRMLGIEGNGNLPNNIAFGTSFVNNTGSTITSLSISYSAGQAYAQNSRLNFFTVQYSTNGGSSWTQIAGLTYNAAYNSVNGNNGNGFQIVGNGTSGANAGGFNAFANTGNANGNFATLSANNVAVSIANASNVMVEWIYNDAGSAGAGTRQTLGFTNVSLTGFGTGYVAKNLTWSAATNRNWTTANTDLDWTNNSGGATTYFTNTDNVTFGNSGVGNVNLQAAGVQPGTITVSNTSGTYSFLNASGATAGIAGGTSLTVNGTGGTLDMSGLTVANSYTGGTNILNGGTLIISNDNQLGGAGAATIDTGGTLAITTGVTSARTWTIGSSGGTVATQGNNLVFSSGSNVILNGTLTTTGSGNVAINGQINGGGSPAVTGGFTVGTGGSVTIGTTDSTVTFGNGMTLNGDLIDNSTARLNFDAGGTSSIYGGSGTIYILGSSVGAGNGGVAISGQAFPNFNALISNLSATAGGTITSNIVLNPANSGNLTGNVPFVAGDITGSTYKTASFLAVIGATTAGETLTVGDSTHTNGIISGNGDLVIGNNSEKGGGAGNLILNAANTYTGNTLIDNAGLITLGTTNTLPTTTNVVFGSLSGAGVATLDLNGNNQQVASISYDGAATGSQSLAIINSSSTAANLTLGGSVTPNKGFGGVISGNLSLVQNGTNTIKLGGIDSYTGTTTINSGTLQISSGAALSGTSGVSLTGGNFGGNGSVAGAITASGGTLYAGSTGAGSLTVANNVTMQSSSTLLIRLSQPASGTTGAEGSDNDTIVVTGGNTFQVGGANLQLIALASSFTSAIPNGGYTYTIVDATAGSGTVDSTTPFANLAGGTSYNDGTVVATVSYSSDTITVDVTAVPEPGCLGLLAFGGLALLRRRRGSHTGSIDH